MHQHVRYGLVHGSLVIVGASRHRTLYVLGFGQLTRTRLPQVAITRQKTQRRFIERQHVAAKLYAFNNRSLH